MKLIDIIRGASINDLNTLLGRLDPPKRPILCNSLNINSKHAWEYARLILHALDRTELPAVNFRHHIVPRVILRRAHVQFDHDIDNMARLTLPEHWLAHRLLAEATSGVVAGMMSNACALIAMDIPGEMSGNLDAMLNVDSTDYNTVPLTNFNPNMLPVRYGLRQKNKYRGDKHWYGVIIEPGRKPYSFSLTTDDENEAIKWKEEQESKLKRFLAGESVEILTIDSGSRKNINPYREVDAFLAYMRNTKNRSEATLDSYATKLKLLLEYCTMNDKLDLYSFSEADALNVVEKIEHLSPATRKTTINLFKTFWQHLMAKYGPSGVWNAWRNIAAPKVNCYGTPTIIWSPAQMDAIMQNAPSMTAKAYWATLRYCGTRNAETMNLRWADWDRDNSTIRISGRVLPVNEPLARILGELAATCDNPEPDEQMFKGLSDDGSHRTRQLQNTIAAMGLKGTIETFRASWLANALAQNVDPATAAMVTGASTPAKAIRWKKDLDLDTIRKNIAGVVL